MRELVYPHRVVLGQGAADELGRLVGAPTDARPLLVVCDHALAARGALAAPLASLAAAGWDVDVFDEVRAEPTVALAEQVRARAAARRHARVVGIGGGSAMDLAKVAAALCGDPATSLDGLRSGAALPSCAPLALVPTTAGTGAEATVVAMLFGDDGKLILKSPSFVPSVAVLDPALVASLPPGPTAATGVDALAHALEALVSNAATPFSDAAGLEAARLVGRWLEPAFADGADLEARAGMLVAANLAGQALNGGVVLGHSIGYILAEQAHLPHGVSTAIALPFCLLYNLAAARGPLDRVAPLLTGRADARAADVVRYTWELNGRLGLPTRPSQAGVEPGRAAEHAARLVAVYPRPTNPRPLDVESVAALFDVMETDDIEAALAAWDGGT